MSLLFMDGFDHVGTAYDFLKWDVISSTTSLYFGAGYGRTGGWGMYMQYDGRYIRKYFPDSSTVIVGCAIMYTGSLSGDPCISLYDDGALQISVVPNGGGGFTVKRGSTELGDSTSGICLQSTWMYLELKVVFSDTVGVIELRANGVEVLNLTGIDTVATGNASADALALSCFSNSNCYYDDLYICDTTGTENTDFLGDVTITTLYPTSDGNSSDFTPSTGVDNYATVDDAQLLNETDYNTATVIGNKDTFGMTTLDGNAPILAVQTVAAVNNLTTGTINVRGISRSGATPADNEGSDFALSQTVKAAMDIFEKEPTDDVAWDVAKVNAAEFGIKVQS